MKALPWRRGMSATGHLVERSWDPPKTTLAAYVDTDPAGFAWTVVNPPRDGDSAGTGLLGHGIARSLDEAEVEADRVLAAVHVRATPAEVDELLSAVERLG